MDDDVSDGLGRGGGPSNSPSPKEKPEPHVPKREEAFQRPDDDPEATRITAERGGRTKVDGEVQDFGNLHAMEVEKKDGGLLGEENELVADLCDAIKTSRGQFETHL